MEIEISVKRQNSPKDEAYVQKFIYVGDGNLTVADWLIEVNKNQAKTNKIAWECSCLEKKCGACAMVVNGYPRLACSVFLKEIQKRKKIKLEPFKKFPLVKDLIVNRDVIFETIKDMKLWLQEKKDSNYSWNYDLQYQSGQCLQCGCCLEICPNFLSENKFVGAVAVMNAYKDMEQNVKDSHWNEMKEEYQKKFFAYCGQALSCKTVCPKNLPIDEIQARLNGYR